MTKIGMRLILSIIIGATLAACATAPVQQSGALLRQSHGYVVAALPRMMGVETPNVTLRSISNGDEFELTPTPTNSEVLGLWVPPGAYEIMEMVTFKKGSYTPIDVQAGKVTDLGGLAWASVGGRERVLLPLRHKDIAGAITAATDPIKEFVSGQRIEWNPPLPPRPLEIPLSGPNMGLLVALMQTYAEEVNKPPLRTQLLAAKSLEAFTKLLVSAAAPIVGESSVGEGGALYVGSNFGQLRRRDAAGTWRSIDTGTVSPITAVEAAGKRIVVGTHDGILLTSADNAQTWKRLHRFDAKETVLSIHLAGSQYLVLTGKFVGTALGTQAIIESLQVYALDLQAQAQPKLIRKIDLPTKVAWFRIYALRGSLADKYYLVNTIERVDRFDTAALTWQKLTPPHDVTHLRTANGGSVITAFKAQGGFSKLSMSTDFGNTWSPLETPPYAVNDIQMESPVSGSASRVEMSAFSSALQFTQYDPASKSWKVTWTAPQAACARTIRDASGKEQFCVSPGGSIFRLGNGKLVPEFLAD